MPVELTYPHIVKNPGKPARLERHPRTRVAMIVVDYQGRGWSAEEIARQYAYLTLPEVHAALAYYHDHLGEIDQEIEAESTLCSPTLRKSLMNCPCCEKITVCQRF